VIEALAKLIGQEIDLILSVDPESFGPYKLVDLILDDVEYGDHKAAAVLEGTDHLYKVNINHIVMIRVKK